MNLASKKLALISGAAMLLFINAFSQQAKLRLTNAVVISYSKSTNLPNFIKLDPAQNIKETDFLNWAVYSFNLPDGVTLKEYNSKTDNTGITHTRYKEYIGDIPVEGSMIITHSKEGYINTINGDFYSALNVSQSVGITEQSALENALKTVHAEKYKWENKEQTQAMREALKQPDFTYFPKGELVMVHKMNTDYSAANIRLAYKFNIYAEKPLSRAYIFVDANSGEIISQEQIIHTADVTGNANTKFSGAQTITSDNNAAGQYRLRETGRGNGIATYNLSNSTNYTNTDFTNTSANWNITGANQAATDAHFGAEKTFDYYKNIHGRNSIDDAGLSLLSYVHYDVNYVNAFWDGQEMTYGDGDVSQGFLIMTGLDVCGHEITHGLTQYTAGLNGGGTGEPDALNEAFSDIFGTTIEWYARPAQHDWIMGAEITCNSAGIQDGIGLRDMSNPNAFGQPNTYLGTNWDNGGEPHNNDGPAIFWYYLLCQGGTGTNTIGNPYAVSAITMDKARFIAYGGLTNYFTPSTTYNDARTYTIQAANDIYGGCSPEVIATTNAWHAVGVGPVFSAVVDASFTSNSTNGCVLPFNVQFNNTSINSGNTLWEFGDGGTSSNINPSHIFTTAGTFNVKLSVSGACGSDSVIKNSYIIVSPPPAPTSTNVFSCNNPDNFTLSANGGGTLKWYTTSNGNTLVNTGSTFNTPSLSSNTTYYVESQTPGNTGNVGPATSSFGTGGIHNNTSTQYITFDVLQPCTIQSVLVNSGAAGVRNVIVWDNTGTQLQSIPVNFSNGINTVVLNIHLTPGTGYRIGGTSMNLWRNNSGPAYPYTLTGAINITGSSAGTGYYYYYYNWQVQNDPCVSARTPVTVTLGGPIVTYVSSMDSVCSSGTAFTLTGGSPSGGTYSGTGVNSGVFDPSISGAGNHTISYTYTDVNGCSNISTHTINVSACMTTGIEASDNISGMILYPNPTNGSVTIEVGMVKDERSEIKLLNTIGQIILSENHAFVTGNNKFSIDLSDLSKGVYFIQIKTSSNVLIKRINKE